MNILITGIHGFVGSSLITSLKNQHTIYGLDIVSPQKGGVLATFGWDEMDYIPTIDVIIHLAGKAHDTHNSTKEQAYFDINVGLTRKIFEYFLQSTAKKFVFFSSVKAVADSVTKEYLTEDEIPSPQTPYGKSKQEAEKYILNEWVNWRKGEGAKGQVNEDVIEEAHLDKKVYILRPCMIHGPGNKGNLNLLYKIVKKGFPWPLGAFENRRSFCSVDNLNFVIQKLIEKNIVSGIYQVADDEALSTNELISLIASSQNQKAKIWNIPRKFINLSAKVGNYLLLPLNSERLKKLTESYAVSNQKIKDALGIDKMPVSALGGFKKTFESFQK